MTVPIKKLRGGLMKTLVAYPSAIKRAKAYKQLDTGEVWGPLWPFVPRKDPGWVMPHHDPELMTLPPGDTFEALVRKAAGGYEVETPTLGAGEFYPRIWRTGLGREQCGDPVLRVEETAFRGSFVNSLEQIEGLFDDLLSIFRVVHPAMNNLDAYGGAIRDIIILACTEVESQWKGVLEANGVPSNGTYFKTLDYVKLLPAMKLDQYEVGLIRYPRISATAPFMGWDASKATQSLTWYTAYNKVKHDREINFEEASLKHAIEAVAACAVMLAAQFGVEALQRHHFKPVFEFRRRPMWEPQDWYYQPIPGQDWVQVRCPL
jgi:hypothetical protein